MINFKQNIKKRKKCNICGICVDGENGYYRLNKRERYCPECFMKEVRKIMEITGAEKKEMYKELVKKTILKKL